MTESSIVQKFYQAHLDRVSRSFAFCIARLDSPMRERVGLGYLICRIVDTIEDAGWKNFAAQEKSFREFDEFLVHKPSRESVLAWRERFPKADVSEGETLLLNDAHQIFTDFHSLPNDAREILAAPILSMSAGMLHFMKRRSVEGELRLRNVSDVNRYCFFVAGVVGEMLSGFVGSSVGSSGGSLNEAAKEKTKTSIQDAFRFGLFLQKINLLKDQAGDEKQGRFLVPSREILRRSLAQDAEIAFRYLRGLPDRALGFRLFCAWSLFLGLASLPWIEQSQGAVDKAKIPRDEAALLLTAIEDNISNHAVLDELYRGLNPPLKPASMASEVLSTSLFGESDQNEEKELLALYSGRLSDREILDLFHGA